MADYQADPVVIVAEHTRDEHIVKLDVGRMLSAGGSKDFADPASAKRFSPLAARIFALGGVQRVVLAGPLVTVTKDPQTSWRELGPKLVEAVQSHLEAGEPVLS